MEKLKVASLFSGCGGMDLGVIGGFNYLNNHYDKNSCKIIYAIDNDKFSNAIYNNNFDHKAKFDDIRNIKSDEIPSHDLLVGGFPCKSFSIVAQNPPRLGYKDENGKLFFEMVRIIKEKSPRFFIAENVKGLLSANNRKAFPLIINHFEDAEYYVKHRLIIATDYGVPQKRERVFIVGFKYKEDHDLFDFPKKIDQASPTLRNVINTETQIEDKYYFSQKAVDGMLRSRHKMNKGRVMDLDKPCNTISSHLSKVSLNSTDPVLFEKNKYRRFTPREAARIQSFPDKFKLDAVSEQKQYIAIGNAVPPVMMWYLTKSLLKVVRVNNSHNINSSISVAISGA